MCIYLCYIVVPLLSKASFLHLTGAGQARGVGGETSWVGRVGQVLLLAVEPAAWLYAKLSAHRAGFPIL